MLDDAPPPRWDHIPDPHLAKRVRTTISSTDADGLPKVPGAGAIIDHDGETVQVMHNGILVLAGTYGGEWNTEIIRSLRGHHEPQEELVFHALVERVAAEGATAPTMIEFGAFWSYYSMWFAASLPGARVIAVEPDEANLAVGRRNVAINGLGDSVEFVHGAIGAEPGTVAPFTGEHDGRSHPVRQVDLDLVLEDAGLARVDLVLVDVQGFEHLLLVRALPSLLAGRVRYLVVSTHHNSISGDALTHQRVLGLLRNAGAAIVAEHSIPESFSGDGLVVASFDERDRDFAVAVSFARAKDSIFDELEFELDAVRQQLSAAQQRLADSTPSGFARRVAHALRRRLRRL